MHLTDKDPKVQPLPSVGINYDLPPIPLDEELTKWFAAGPLSFGLEQRVVDATTVIAAYSEEQRATSSADVVKPGVSFDDEGPSIHVCDADSRRELLRFDCFGDTPHYHYIHVDGGNRVVAFDTAANGDMLQWAGGCLRTHLPEMLGQVGAIDIATRLDPALVDKALTAVFADLGASAQKPPPLQS